VYASGVGVILDGVIGERGVEVSWLVGMIVGNAAVSVVSVLPQPATKVRTTMSEALILNRVNMIPPLVVEN
jgi:hypothetical protein